MKKLEILGINEQGRFLLKLGTFECVSEYIPLTKVGINQDLKSQEIYQTTKLEFRFHELVVTEISYVDRKGITTYESNVFTNKNPEFDEKVCADITARMLDKYRPEEKVVLKGGKNVEDKANR